MPGALNGGRKPSLMFGANSGSVFTQNFGDFFNREIFLSHGIIQSNFLQGTFQFADIIGDGFGKVLKNIIGQFNVHLFGLFFQDCQAHFKIDKYLNEMAGGKFVN